MVESTVKPLPFEIHSVVDGIARILHRTDIQSEDRLDEVTEESTTIWVYEEDEYRVPVRFVSAAAMRAEVRDNPDVRERVATMLEKQGASRAAATDVSRWVSDDDVATVTHWAKIESFQVGARKPLAVRRTWKGHTVVIDCYVTQDIVDAYQAGALTVGDYVLVEFVDGDRAYPVATQKIYKTW